MNENDACPVYRDCVREAVFVLAFWVACFIWSVGYCYLFGYSAHPRVPGDVSSLAPNLQSFDRTSESLTIPLGLGIPDWAVWGVIVPWLVCIAVTIWFCFGFMKDDPESLAASESGGNP